jgi:hypothetical protein
VDHVLIIPRAADICVNGTPSPRDPRHRFFTLTLFSLYSENMSGDEELMLRALVNALPRGAARITRAGAASDADIVAELPDGSTCGLDLVWAGAGFPRDVERVLVRMQRDTTGEAQLVVVARSLSPGSRALLAAEDVSWVALDGSASLHIGTVWVERAAVATPTEDRRTTAWTASTAAVAEVLLDMIATGRTSSTGPEPRPLVPDVESLATLSGRSLGTVAKTLAGFDQRGWTAPGPARRSRVVEDPAAVFDSWADWQAGRSQQWDGFHVLVRERSRVEDQLIAVFGTDAILTGVSVSERAAPFLTGTPTVTAYVDAARDEIERRAEAGDLLPTPGGRLRLAPAPTQVSRTARSVEDRRVASDVRTYVDLLAGSEREREAASAFRSVALSVFA